MGLAPFLRQSHAKLHSPIPVPQLRCPSDIQVLRPEASSSSPDLLLLDIFIILIWPVCVFICLTFPWLSPPYYSLFLYESLSNIPNTISRLSTQPLCLHLLSHSVAQPAHPNLIWCQAWPNPPACGLSECYLTARIDKKLALNRLQTSSFLTISSCEARTIGSQAQGSHVLGTSKTAWV